MAGQGLFHVLCRIGLAGDIPALKLGEIGYDTDTNTFRVGNDSVNPPKIPTTLSSGYFDFSTASGFKFSKIDMLAGAKIDGVNIASLKQNSGLVKYNSITDSFTQHPLINGVGITVTEEVGNLKIAVDNTIATKSETAAVLAAVNGLQQAFEDFSGLFQPAGIVVSDGTTLANKAFDTPDSTLILGQTANSVTFDLNFSHPVIQGMVLMNQNSSGSAGVVGFDGTNYVNRTIVSGSTSISILNGSTLNGNIQIDLAIPDQSEIDGITSFKALSPKTLNDLTIGGTLFNSLADKFSADNTEIQDNTKTRLFVTPASLDHIFGLKTGDSSDIATGTSTVKFATPASIKSYINSIKAIEADIAASDLNKITTAKSVKDYVTTKFNNFSGSLTLISTQVTDALGYTPYYGGSSGVNFTVSDVSVTKFNASIWLNKTASGQSSQILGTKNGVARWIARLGNDETESGSNTGSNFDLLRYNDAGVFIDTVLNINRATKEATFYGSITNYNNHYINSNTSAQLVLNKAAGSTGNLIWGQRNSVNYWSIELGNWAADAFTINRFNDSGVWQETAFSINRTGDVNIKSSTFYSYGAARLNTSRFNIDGSLEIGIYGSGDRAAYTDFHASGTPESLDYSGRIIRNSSVNGSLDILNTGSGEIKILPGTNATIQLGVTDNNNQVYISRQGNDEGGQLVLAIPATNTILTSDVVADNYHSQTRIYSYVGGNYRGVYIDWTGIPTGSYSLVHGGNLNSYIAGGDTQDVGKYVFAYNLGSSINYGGSTAGSNLYPGNHGGTYQAGSINGTWRCHGHGGNGFITLWQRTG